jgi:hypothetical protein
MTHDRGSLQLVDLRRNNYPDDAAEENAMKKVLLACAAIVALNCATAQAAVYSFTAPEYRGDGNNGPALIQTWNVILDPGETIVSASFVSSFGYGLVTSSSVGTVTVGGVQVGACAGIGDPCWEGLGAPIAYDFSPAQFGSLVGQVDLVYNQTDCCRIRLGFSELTIETTMSPVPLPAAGWLMAQALALLLLAGRRKKAARG